MPQSGTLFVLDREQAAQGLGVSTRSFDRLRQAGHVPSPEYVDPDGRHLWRARTIGRLLYKLRRTGVIAEPGTTERIERPTVGRKEVLAEKLAALEPGLREQTERDLAAGFQLVGFDRAGLPLLRWSRDSAPPGVLEVECELIEPEHLPEVDDV